MDKRKKWILVLAIAQLAVSCNNTVEKEAVKQELFPVVTATEAKQNIVDMTFHYEINLTYPVIDGELSPEVLNAVNNTIALKFPSFMYLDEFIESHTTLPDDMFDRMSDDWRGYLHNTYEIKQCDSILTIWFSVYHYFLGAAHGSSSNHTLYFDLSTGKELSITDFFNTDPQALRKIQTTINQSLSDSVCWGLESDSLTLNALENTLFSTDSVIIKFDDYALCPYAFSISSLSFPKSAFADVFKLKNTQNCLDIIAVQDEGEIASH